MAETDHTAALHSAVKAKDLGEVQRIIDSGVNVSAFDVNGWTAMHYALKRNFPEALELLIAHGAIFNSRDYDGMTPLLWAISLGRVSSVQRLVEAGAGLDVPDKDGLTSLHWAVKMISIDAVRCVVEHGAELDARDKYERTPIHWAIWNNALDVLEYLLEAGADVNARNQNGRAAVHLALEAGKMDALQILIRYHADLDVKDNEGSALIHVAVRQSNIKTIQFLMERGVDVEAQDNLGLTAVGRAVEYGSLEPIEYLVDHGASVNVADATGLTPLHLACLKGSEEAVRHFINMGADVHAMDKTRNTVLHTAVRGFATLEPIKLLIEHGIQVNTLNEKGFSPLHVGVLDGNPGVVHYLITENADVNLTLPDHDNVTPLKSALFRDLTRQTNSSSDTSTAVSYSIVKMLCEAGASWDPTCVAAAAMHPVAYESDDVLVSRLRASGYTGSNELALSTLHSRGSISSRGWQPGLVACAQYWIQQRSKNIRLIDIPEETIRLGKQSVNQYIASLQNTAPATHARRRKACIVGPSGEGKSSLIQSLVSMTSELVHADDRTIGVTLSRLEVVKRDTADTEPTRFEFTFWDFAGQDIYQVAHSLFFSKRTLYMLSIDLQVYDRVMTAAADEPERLRDEMLGRFVHHRVFRWARAILARQPDAELVIVGTKSDGLAQDTITHLLDDLRRRLEMWSDALLNELKGATQSAVAKSLKEFQLRQPIVVNVTSTAAVAQARQAINDALTLVPERSFLMPADYRAVLEAIFALRQHADGHDRATGMAMLVMPLDALISRLQESVDGVNARACRTILRTLHDLGDILWYERVGGRNSSDVVILDPVILLDIVRDVVNHTHEANDGEAYEELQRDGVLRHSLLVTFPIWEALVMQGDAVLLFFKKLLQLFNLAYPTNNSVMAPDSDLVVPAYWKLKKSKPQMGTAMEVMQTSRAFTYAARWQYSVPADVAQCVYDQFIVKSASPRFVRSATAEGVLTSVPFQFDTTFRLEEVAKNKAIGIIRIDVQAATETICWGAVRSFVSAMETVLEGFPGLAPITREVARVGRNKRLEVFAVDRVVAQLHAARSTPARRLGRGLPFDLGWYTQKAWSEPEQLAELEHREQVALRERQQRILDCLAEEPVKRTAPALWKVVFDMTTLVVELQALSDLSGECCHAPFQIGVAPSFCTKYRSCLEMGTSLLSFLPPHTTTRMLETFAQGPVNPLPDVATIQYVATPFVLDRRDNHGAGSDVMAMLRALLERFDSMIDEEKLWELCNLEPCRVSGRSAGVVAPRVKVSPPATPLPRSGNGSMIVL